MHVPEGHRIPHLNTPRVPDGVDDAKVRKHLLEKNGIEIAGGFGPLAGKIFRIGLMSGRSSTLVRNTVTLRTSLNVAPAAFRILSIVANTFSA